ncbi:MAG: cupin domain-containing protein, partial [Solirubrobacteraceae bacterium]
PVVNATAVELEPWPDASPGFRALYRALGPMLGGELIGGSVYGLAPGEHLGPYHYEIGNEECLLVLAGTPTLRHPEGRDLLVAGDMVVFPDGPSGAHQLINESTDVARVAMLSTTRGPYACAYPDSGKLSTVAGIFRITDAVGYWEGESAG